MGKKRGWIIAVNGVSGRKDWADYIVCRYPGHQKLDIMAVGEEGICVDAGSAVPQVWLNKAKAKEEGRKLGERNPFIEWFKLVPVEIHEE